MGKMGMVEDELQFPDESRMGKAMAMEHGEGDGRCLGCE